jgi:hypothetical protein
MRRLRCQWRPCTALLTAALGLSGAFGLTTCRAAESGPVSVRVGSRSTGQPIQPGFVGLSLEYPVVLSYAGTDPTALNPVFEQLVRDFAPGQRPVIRIAGDSADWSWWPVPGVRKPPGIRYTLTNSWLAVGRALATAVNARLILGVNLEADSGRVAGGMASALIKGLGSTYIAGLELGNEPELYSGFAWYKTSSGRKVLGRPHGWSFDSYIRDFGSIARSLPHAPLIGPSIGSPTWMVYLRRYLQAQPRTRLVTLHRYPFKNCTGTHALTPSQLLSDDASRGLAASVAPYVGIAHGRHIPLRVDEMGSISCGGQRGLSETFAVPLWAIDALFEMARVGVDGVNIHSSPASYNQLFVFHHAHGTWTGEVHPIYYGLMMFTQAAPPGSRLLRTAQSRSSTAVKTWATRATDGTIRVTLINRGVHTRTIRIHARSAAATLTRLKAPSVHATTGVTLGGQTFGTTTTTGLLSGEQKTESPAPKNGTYTIKLPPTSAALLTIPH